MAKKGKTHAKATPAEPKTEAAPAGNGVAGTALAAGDQGSAKAPETAKPDLSHGAGQGDQSKNEDALTGGDDGKEAAGSGGESAAAQGGGVSGGEAAPEAGAGGELHAAAAQPEAGDGGGADPNGDGGGGGASPDAVDEGPDYPFERVERDPVMPDFNTWQALAGCWIASAPPREGSRAPSMDWSIMGELSEATGRETAIEAAAFVRKWRDAKPDAIAIHLQRLGRPVPAVDATPAGRRRAAGWKAFAFVLNELDAIDREAAEAAAAAERQAEQEAARRRGMPRDRLTMQPYDNDPRTQIARTAGARRP